MTIDQAISDAELLIYGGKPSDDAEIPRRQIQQWLDIANSAAVANWIETKNGGEIPSFATRQEFCIGAVAEESECLGADCTYYYIPLPKTKDGETVSVLNLVGDKSIVGLFRGQEEIYNYGTVGRSRIMSRIRFAEKQPYLHRVGDRIYLFNGIYPPFCKFNLVYATVSTIGLDEENTFPTVDELLPLVMEEVEKKGRRELEKGNDLISDGIDE